MQRFLIIFFLGVGIALSFIPSVFVYAQTTTAPVSSDLQSRPYVAPPSDAEFVPLVGLPGLTDTTEDRKLADYLNALFRLAIGIAALIAVIKIVIAGIKYMGTDSFGSKEQAKKDIQGALFGLLLILSTVVILRVIYPDILNVNVLQQLESVSPTKKATQPYTGPVRGDVKEGTPTTQHDVQLKEEEVILSSTQVQYISTSGASVKAREAFITFSKGCDGSVRRTRSETRVTGQGTVITEQFHCIGIKNNPTETSERPTSTPSSGDDIAPYVGPGDEEQSTPREPGDDTGGEDTPDTESEVPQTDPDDESVEQLRENIPSESETSIEPSPAPETEGEPVIAPTESESNECEGIDVGCRAGKLWDGFLNLF